MTRGGPLAVCTRLQHCPGAEEAPPLNQKSDGAHLSPLAIGAVVLRREHGGLRDGAPLRALRRHVVHDLARPALQHELACAAAVEAAALQVEDHLVVEIGYGGAVRAHDLVRGDLERRRHVHARLVREQQRAAQLVGGRVVRATRHAHRAAPDAVAAVRDCVTLLLVGQAVARHMRDRRVHVGDLPLCRESNAVDGARGEWLLHLDVHVQARQPTAHLHRVHLVPRVPLQRDHDAVEVHARHRLLLHVRVREVGLVAEVHAAQRVGEVCPLAHILLHDLSARAVLEHDEQVGVAQRRLAARADARAISRPGREEDDLQRLLHRDVLGDAHAGDVAEARLVDRGPGVAAERGALVLPVLGQRLQQRERRALRPALEGRQAASVHALGKRREVAQLGAEDAVDDDHPHARRLALDVLLEQRGARRLHGCDHVRR
mmetsp:Transcript_81914/g.198814  ORF Transcript_81914/g.198814 Transcript_81914/m.198814 type:complete len:432 (+) Transcript_81914:169-1464(+)